MSIGLNTTQAQVHLEKRQDNFKMDELGGERAISIGRDNKIVKAEIMDAPNRPQHKPKPHKANTGFEHLFKITIDKCEKWRSAGKLRRAQDAIEVNLGRMAGKFINLQALFVDDKLLSEPEKNLINAEKNSLMEGIAAELSAFETEIDSLVRSYGLPREDTELLFLQRLINSLKNENTDALSRMKVAVDVVAKMPCDNPVKPRHEALLSKFNGLLNPKSSEVVAEPVVQQSVPQKLVDTFKDLFRTKEERALEYILKKLHDLEQLCDIGGSEMVEITNQFRSMQRTLKNDPKLTMDKFDGYREQLDTIIGATIKLGREVAQKALETESAKMPGQLAVNKYQPQLVSAEEANRDLSTLFLSKNTTVERVKSQQSPIGKSWDNFMRNHIRSETKSIEKPHGLRFFARSAVQNVNDMTRKFVAARQELKGLEVEFSAIALAKQLAAKSETPPEGVDENTWREACSVMTTHLLDAPGSLISTEDVPALDLIKANAEQFTEGLEGVAVERFKKLLTRLDANTLFTAAIPKPSPQQIEKFKQTGEILMQENAERFNEHMQQWQNSAPKTGIPELDKRLPELRAPITQLTLDPAKLDDSSLRSTLGQLEGRIELIKMAYSYETAVVLSGIGDKQARLEQQMKLFVPLNTELQELTRLEADLEGMINMRTMGRLASEGLDMLRQSCPKGAERGAWESDCNAIVDFIMEHPHDFPGEETVAVFERLLDTLNNSLSTGSSEDQQKVELYNKLKDDLNEWKDFGFFVGDGRSSLNNMEHMKDVRERVSQMATARIRIDDVVNLMQDSFISLTKAGFSHSDELRSNLSEYSKKLMTYTDAMSRTSEMAADVPLIRQEAQESLSKTIHSFFPAMEFLAEQEHLYKVNPTGFTLAQAQQVRDLRATMFNAYAAISDIGRNVSTLGVEAAWVSPLHQSTLASQIVNGMHGLGISEAEMSEAEMSARKYHRDAAQEEFKKVHLSSSNDVSERTKSIMQNSEAMTNYLIEANRDKQITNLFISARRLTTALVEAKAKGLDPAIATSIERSFSEHMLSPVESFTLEHFIPNVEKATNFENNFEELHGAMDQAFAILQFGKMNVKSTQTRINSEAEKYLAECVEIPWHPIDQHSLRSSLTVVSSHDVGGIMSRILIKSDLTEVPRMYDVSLSGGKVTFTPTDDKSGKGVFTAPVAYKNARFPMGEAKK